MASPYDEALAAVGLSHDGRGFHSPRTSIQGDTPYGLTQGEVDVVLLIVGGLTSREIAAELHLSEMGVKWRLTNIYAKMDCTSRTQAAVRWVREQES